jgi:tRNA(Ile)-lysidine synthase TilS/MesJ
MELIRPMVYIKEKDIINFMKYSQIEAMKCGCKVAAGEIDSKRKKVKELIAGIKKDFPNVEISIYRSAENVNLNCVLGWKKKNEKYSFLDEYEID